MGRDREVALFSVETVGALSPCVIFKESCKVLMNKCDVFLEELTRTQNDVKDEMKNEFSQCDLVVQIYADPPLGCDPALVSLKNCKRGRTKS